MIHLVLNAVVHPSEFMTGFAGGFLIGASFVTLVVVLPLIGRRGSRF